MFELHNKVTPNALKSLQEKTNHTQIYLFIYAIEISNAILKISFFFFFEQKIMFLLPKIGETDRLGDSNDFKPALKHRWMKKE